MEVVALLTSLNAMGIPAGHMAIAAILYVILKRDLKKSMKEELPTIIGPLLKPLVTAIENHEQTYNKRLERIEHKLEIKQGE